MHTINIESLDIVNFLAEAEKAPIIDVRTPAEFELGHIPGAQNIPLFSNEERAIIGTIYKRQNKEKAVEKGLEFVGSKLAVFVKQARKIARNKKILVHCWRGGMRSSSMAWLFNTAGLHTQILTGGYKSFRRAGKELLSSKLPIVVIGGHTGSGKTEFLQALQKNNAQIIDLEGLAHHKGSAFGHIGEQAQPSTEQFENNLYFALRELNLEQPIFMEDESRSIGKVWIPDELFRQIRQAPVVVLQTPTQERLQRLVKDYTPDKEVKSALRNSVLKIEKRLGGLRTKNSLKAIDEGDYFSAAKEILPYYDKTYSYGLSKREKKSLFKLEVLKKNMDIATSNLLKSDLLNQILKFHKPSNE